MFSHKGIFLIFLWNFRRRWLLLFLNSLLEIFFLLCAKWFTRFYMKCCLKSKSIYCLWTVVWVLWFLIFLDGRRFWHLHLLRIYTCKRLSWHWSVLHTCFSWNRRKRPQTKVSSLFWDYDFCCDFYLVLSWSIAFSIRSKKLCEYFLGWETL